MKISKTAATTARRLFTLCQTNGRVDESKLRTAIQRLVESQPREYRAILAALHRLTRLELNRRKVLVESATELDETTRSRIITGLTSQYGPDLVFSYAIEPSLIGGLRIRVGDDVLDGSIHGRLRRFASAF